MDEVRKTPEESAREPLGDPRYDQEEAFEVRKELAYWDQAQVDQRVREKLGAARWHLAEAERHFEVEPADDREEMSDQKQRVLDDLDTALDDLATLRREIAERPLLRAD